MPIQLEVITCRPDVQRHKTPLLCIHGKWHGPWCWSEHFLPYLAERGYVAHALALRGHGQSEGGERLRWATISDYVADVAQVACEISPAPVLIGHSMGGLVVQKYLEQHTAPAGILLASTPPAGALRATLRMLRRHPKAVLRSLLRFSMWPLVETPQLARDVLFSAMLPDEKLLRYHARLQDDSPRAYLDEVLLNRPRPARVSAAMLVLGAERDALFTPQEVMRTAHAYGVQADIFPAMGHDMMLEPNWPAVASHIVAWLGAQGL